MNAGSSGYDVDQVAQAMAADIQFKDVMNFYNSTIETCFNKCINSFQTRNLTPDEQKCAHTCAAKIFQANSRISIRFAEVIQSKDQGH